MPPSETAEVPAEARALLAALAVQPRPAGSAAETRARARCAAWLRACGFDVRAERFTYSTLPGRWGTPAAGLAAGGAIVGAALLGRGGAPGSALVLLTAAAVALAAAARWMARRGVLALPARATSENLVAERPAHAGRTRVWLVAHLDSKSQPVPIALRAVGVIGTAAVWVVAAALALAQLAGVDARAVWPLVGVVGAVVALPVALTVVGSASDGAVDNASGVAAVLEAARRVAPAHAVGVLLTSAEELGLAGARAWAAHVPPAVALNCDGVDDAGPLVAMYSGRRPARLADVLATVGEGRVHVRRLLPGVLTDGVALADAGWPVVTLSRGTRATLRRIHTRRDDLAHLAGDGLADAAEVLARAATALAAPAGAAAPAAPAAPARGA
ncbi:MAG TPA: M28 family peptidase [Gemmatimonadaceae bacterium]|nr:M28 family peptidase [Gemmatimonadaceae bacterium]